MALSGLEACCTHFSTTLEANLCCDSGSTFVFTASTIVDLSSCNDKNVLMPVLFISLLRTFELSYKYIFRWNSFFNWLQRKVVPTQKLLLKLWMLTQFIPLESTYHVRVCKCALITIYILRRKRSKRKVRKVLHTWLHQLKNIGEVDIVLANDVEFEILNYQRHLLTSLLPKQIQSVFEVRWLTIKANRNLWMRSSSCVKRRVMT